MSARMLMTTGGGLPEVTIVANVRNPNIRALALAAGWDGVGKFRVVVNAGVDVAHIETLIANIPHDTLTLVNNGRIGGMRSGSAGTTGADRGVYTTSRITIENNGTIFGKGGQGGPGETISATHLNEPGNRYFSYGGGGGEGQGFSPSGPVVMLAASNGSDATRTDYQGAVTGGQHWLWGGPGGAGFPVGQGMVDPTGGYSSYTGQWTNIIKSFTSTTSRSYATGGNALITWITIGTVLGERV